MKTFGQDISREEAARQDVEATRISRVSAWALVVFFALIITAIPVAQCLIDIAEHMSDRRATMLPDSLRIGECIQEACTEMHAADVASLADRAFLFNRLLNRNIRKYESGLEESSFLSELLIPPAQFVFSRVLRTGNEKVYTGRRGWLYYRDDVDYVTGRGFMEPSVQKMRRNSDGGMPEAVEPDPFPAIIEFRDFLRARGIDLLLLPVPVKPSVHPEYLGRKAEKTGQIPNNSSFEQFLERAKAQGIECVSLHGLMASMKSQSDVPLYLKTDTHWSPETMTAVAKHVAGVIKGRCGPAEAGRYSVAKAEVYNQGDTARMHNMPAWALKEEKEMAVVDIVLSSDGRSVWRSDRNSPVLVLGDSFANIYSMPSLGWGKSAGLTEHISLHLGLPVDRILRNDDGAFASREMLWTELKADKDRLKSTRIVIWEFSERELMNGNWKRLMLK